MSATAIRTDLQAFAADCGVTLEPFQRKIARAIDGPEREAVVLLPRGNGKTHLLALIALHHLVTTPGASVYVAAASREQARILYEAAARYARVLDHQNIVPRHLELRWCDDPDEPKVFSRHLRVLAADAPRLHGLTYSLAIVDELQAHRTDDVYVAMASALHKLPGAKLITISTAGQGADSPLGRLRARALAQPSVTRRGGLTDARGPGMRMLEWVLDEDADVDDARVVKRVNPASWITRAQLAHAREALPDIAYRRFVANMWTEREGHWLPAGAWQACVGAPDFTPGERVFVGVDVGGERSATAVAWINESLHVGVEILHGDQAVLEAAETIRELATTFAVREVVFDPWRAGQLAAELEREGLLCTAFPQNDSRMIPASSTLHEAIVERRLTLPANDELAQHAANTIARHGRRGWRIDKPDGRTQNDAIIALCMCVDAALNTPEPVRLLGWL